MPRWRGSQLAAASAAVTLVTLLLPTARSAHDVGPLSGSGPVGGRDPKHLTSIAQESNSILADIHPFRANATAEIAASAAKDIAQAWADYKARWGRNYSSPEDDDTHFQRFKRTLDYISRYNTNATGGSAAFMKLGPLADATEEEYRRLNGLRITTTNKTKSVALEAPTPTSMLGSPGGTVPPSTVNWVAAGKVSDIKNQGSCGDCWAFAATAVTESMTAIQYNRNATSLSAQQVLDCTPGAVLGTTSGCVGSDALYAGLIFPYTRLGLASDSDYPYTGQPLTCKTEVNSIVNLTIAGEIPYQNEAALMQALQNGPVIVGVAASSMAFQQYGGGLFNDFSGCSQCYSTSQGDYTCEVNHAVALVGYDNDTRYWILRNSWGADWGIGGYMLLSMGTSDAYPFGLCNVLQLNPVAASVPGSGNTSGTTTPNYYAAIFPTKAALNRKFYGGAPLSFDTSPPPPLPPPTLPPSPPSPWRPPPAPPSPGGVAAVRALAWQTLVSAVLLALGLLMMA